MVVFFDAPAPGNATKAQSTRLQQRSLTVFLQLTNQVGDQGSGELGALTAQVFINQQVVRTNYKW
jgi:hypothetical protein